MEAISKLSWIINNACNLKCIHCYPNSGVEIRDAFADEMFEKLVANFNGITFRRTFLSGGEPIIDINFYRYLEIAKTISDEVYICSNGTLLNQEKIEELSNHGVDGIVLSCQTLDRDSSVTICGKPTVPECVLNSIKLIQKTDIALSVEITMLRQNIDQIDTIIESLISLGVKSISFKRLLPVGRGASKDVVITKEENYALLNKIYHWQSTNSNIRFNVHDPLYGTVLFDHIGKISNDKKILDWIRGYSCRAGTKWIGIDPWGNVSPCPILLYKDMLIGNILETPLKTILDESPIIKMFNDLENQAENTSCKYGNFCLGCRATAIARNGNMFTKDPMCVYKDGVCPIVKMRGDN